MLVSKNHPGTAASFNPIVIFIRGFFTHQFDDHEDDRGAQPTSYDDQKKFHDVTLATLLRNTIPAMVGLAESAEMAAFSSISRGISAHVPLCRASALMQVSEKEDLLWMNIPKPSPAVPAASVFWSRLSSSYLCCFMRFSQAAARPQQLTQQHWARLIKAPLYLKKLHQPNLLLLQRANNAKTTHVKPRKGGRSNAPAFSLRVHHSSIEVCPC